MHVRRLLTVCPHVGRERAAADGEVEEIEDPSLQQRICGGGDSFKKGCAEDGDWVWTGFEGFTELGE